jgi:hypothetical protein
MSWNRKNTERSRNYRQLGQLTAMVDREPEPTGQAIRSAAYIRATEALVRLANLDRALERM